MAGDLPATHFGNRQAEYSRVVVTKSAPCEEIQSKVQRCADRIEPSCRAVEPSMWWRGCAIARELVMENGDGKILMGKS
jgi:hypothetical protein